MNYYEILKVSKNASIDDIKSSYKSLVKKYHPDLYPGDKTFAEKKIKQINEAYEILSNEEKRKEYDDYLNSKEQYTPPDYRQDNSSYYTTQTEPEKSTTQNYKQKESFVSSILFKSDNSFKPRIFIFVLILALALILINLIQAKHFLTNINSNIETKENTANEEENTNTFFNDEFWKNYYFNNENFDEEDLNDEDWDNEYWDDEDWNDEDWDDADWDDEDLDDEDLDDEDLDDEDSDNEEYIPETFDELLYIIIDSLNQQQNETV